MADEIVKIIRIESDGAEQTVASLVNEIKNLTEAMNGVTKGTEEYTNILKQLSENQEKLGKAMKTNKQEVSAAEGSYNALVKQMSSLKKQWRETTDEVSRKELGNQIKGINEKLKKMDASIGDFRRNVGNYAGSIKDAFGVMGGAAKGMIGPLNSVKGAFTALSAHPLVAVLTALAALLINGIAKGFKSSEDNMNKLRVAFSGFQAIGDAVTKMLQSFAGWLAKVAEGAMNFADKLGLINPKMKQRQEMMKKQIELEKQERDNIVKNAELETQAAELRAKASDEENYTIEQRIQFLQEAQAKEQEQLELEKAILEQKVAQLEAQLALTDSTGEELTKLNELKAQVIQVNAKIAQSQRSTNKEIAGLRRRGLSEQQQANQARLNLEKDLLKQEYDLAVKGSDDQLRLAKELRDKELEIQLETLKGKIKNRKDYEKAAKLAVQAHNQDIRNLESQHALDQVQHDKEMADLRLKSLNQNSIKYYQEAKAAATKYHSDLKELLDKETDQARKEELQKLEADALQTMYNLADSLTDAEVVQTERFNQLVLNSARPMSAFYIEQIRNLTNMINYWEELGGKFGDVMDEETNENIENKLRIQELMKTRNEAIVNFRKAVKEEGELAKRYATDQKYWSKIYDENWYWVWDLQPKIMDQLDENSEALFKYFDEVRRMIGKYVHKNFDAVASDFRHIAEDQYTKLVDVYDETVANAEKEKIEAYYRQLFGVDTMDQITGEVLAKVMSTQEEAQKIVDELFKYNLLPENLRDEYLQTLEALTENEAALLNQRYENWDNLAKGIGQLMSSIGDIYSIKLENEKKALEKEGKYTEQERKNLEERYKTVQAMQIAEATINTISGAIAAFMKCQELGQPWGAILGAVQAAAVTAAGVAQIMKIKQTNPYSDTSSNLSSGGGMMSATVQPTVSDYNPEYTTNLTGRSDTEYLNEALGKTRLVVSVSEINEVQNRVRVVESESQF